MLILIYIFVIKLIILKGKYKNFIFIREYLNKNNKILIYNIIKRYLRIWRRSNKVLITINLNNCYFPDFFLSSC